MLEKKLLLYEEFSESAKKNTITKITIIWTHSTWSRIGSLSADKVVSRHSMLLKQQLRAYIQSFAQGGERTILMFCFVLLCFQISYILLCLASFILWNVFLPHYIHSCCTLLLSSLPLFLQYRGLTSKSCSCQVSIAPLTYIPSLLYVLV